MHLHLDPVGGIAGDMFAAALIDLRPALAGELQSAFDVAGFSTRVRLRSFRHRDHGLSGQRFEVEDLAPGGTHAHRSYRDIRALLGESPLDAPVRDRALAMFELLARAEGGVHGVPMDEVSFHEVGAWDSIADIVAAASLIESFPDATWSCAPLPLGSGRVETAHGRLPVPAPATARLLEGYPVYQDGIIGERITPTGAAILRHLDPSFSPLARALRLTGSGMGFGSRVLEGTSNTLRVLALEEVEAAATSEPILVCQFEVDDQTPEDLAVALENLRASVGVIDVMHASVSGKKGRLGAQIQLLVQPDSLTDALERCFIETSTLGVRWQTVQRAVLDRETASFEIGGRTVSVKQARRPGGTTTSKAEMDDLGLEPGGLAARERVRREAEHLALQSENTQGKGKSNAEDS